MSRFTRTDWLHSPNLLVYLLVGIFILVGANVLWYSAETASNLLHGDDWRWMVMFYKKWADGTFQFKDLFADHHPMSLHPLVFLANAKWFSLQMRLGAFLGMFAKLVAGALLLWQILSHREGKGGLLGFLFVLYIILLFFGMNRTVEYSWGMVTYETSIFFLLAIIFLMLIDRVMTNTDFYFDRLAAAFLSASIAILLLGTLMKLLLLVVLCAILPLAIFEREARPKILGVMAMVMLVIVAHTAFIHALGLPNNYNPSVASITDVVSEWAQNILYIGYGLAAGILSPHLFHYPSNTSTIFALLCIGVVGYATVVFYINRMWRVTLLPIVLLFYSLAVIIGAIVFRNAEIGSGWPLDIPRYFAYYHMGWVGVIWIFYIKWQSVTNKLGRKLLMLSLITGSVIMLYSVAVAWKGIVYIKNANAESEMAVCNYAYGKGGEEDIPFYIRGHSFSMQAVSILKENKLSIFKDKTSASNCQSVRKYR